MTDDQQDDLARLSARFKALLDYNIDAISLTDENGIILYISRAVKSILGYEPNELIGTRAFDLIHPEGRDKYIEIRSSLLLPTPGKMFKTFLNLRRKDGAYVWIEAVIVNRLSDPLVRAIVANWRKYPETGSALIDTGGGANGYDTWIELDDHG